MAYNVPDIKFQGPLITAFYIDEGFSTLGFDYDNGTSPIVVRNMQGFEVSRVGRLVSDRVKSVDALYRTTDHRMGHVSGSIFLTDTVTLGKMKLKSIAHSINAFLIVYVINLCLRLEAPPQGSG